MKIGFIGLGMGESMVKNIVKKHDDTVYVFDFVKKVELLVSKELWHVKPPVELAEKSDVIISMVPKSEHSRAVYSEILDALDETKTCIDMSTIDPSASIEIAEMVKRSGEKDGSRLHRRSGCKIKTGPIAGKLVSIVGGDEQTFEKCAGFYFTWRRYCAHG